MVPAVRSSGEHIQAFAAKPNPKPQDALAVTRAFHKFAHVKIVRQIRDENIELRRKAIHCSRELLAVDIHQYQCIEAGIVSALNEAMKDSDEGIRQSAAQALEYVAGRNLGCQKLIDDGAIAQLVVLLQDVVVSVRKAVYKTLVQASNSIIVRKWLSNEEEGGLLSTILKYAITESDSECGAMALQLVRCCLSSSDADLVSSRLIDIGAVELCHTILTSAKAVDLVENVGSVLGLLCLSSEGKNRAQKAGTVKEIVTVMKATNSQEEGVLAALVAAVMSMTIDIRSKNDFVEAGGVECLISCLGSTSRYLIANTLQAITNVAEHPEGRTQLQGALPLLSRIAEDEAALADKRTIEDCIRQVKFKHLPYQSLSS